MEINVIGGALYTQDGKKIADVKDSSIMLVDEPYKQRTMEVAKNIGKTHSITCQLAPYDMRMIYSFMYGIPIPKGEYYLGRLVSGLKINISGGSHGGHNSGNGSHEHSVTLPKVKAGDTVLVTWVKNTPVVVDVVKKS